MNQYHKINSLFKRDEKGKLLYGEYSDPEVEYLKDNKWYFTEKVDGTNIRVMWYNPEGLENLRQGPNFLKFGGKTDKAQTPKPLLDKLGELFIPGVFQEKFGNDDVCLYGEGYGAGIQKGGDYTGDGSVNFILFDVRIGDWWLKREDVVDIADHFGIKVVPHVFTGTIYDAITLVAGTGYVSLVSKTEDHGAEGVIGTPLVPLSTRAGKRIITKIKTVDFPYGWGRGR